MTTDWDYDNRNRVVAVTHRDSGGTVLASRTYVRDPSGEPTMITNEDGSRVEIDYDTAWRIDEERYYDAGGTLLETIDYGYDLDGNRTARTTNAGSESLAYSAGYQLDTVTGGAAAGSFAYDGAGRVTSLTRSTTNLSITYDSDDQILTASDSVSGESATYTYDGFDRRVGATDSAGSREYLVATNIGSDLESPQAVLDAATGTLASTFVYAGEHAVMRIDSAGNPVYYLRDAMGSVLSLADGSGAEVGEFEYDAFGNERSMSGVQAALPANLGGDFRYHGQWKERATGLYYVRARTYDPASGRFLSRDPIEGAELEPETFHAYTWASNNPWVYRDPTGLFSLVNISVANGITGQLQNVSRSSLVNFFRQRAKDEVLGVAGDLFLDAIEKLMPLITPDLGSTIAVLGGGDAGRAFESGLTGAVCEFLGAGTVPDSLFLEVSVNASTGEPANNGYNCPPQRLTNIGGVPRPDFIFSSENPRDLNRNGDKSYTIGDFKLRLANFRDQSRTSAPSKQWRAIVNHAKNFSYSKAGMLITFFEPTQRQKRTMLGRARRDKVVLVLVSISGKRG